jgi:PAS domain S-box-containing protein
VRVDPSENFAPVRAGRLALAARARGCYLRQVSAITDQDGIIESVHLSPLALVLSKADRPDLPLEIVNSAFCELTGYAEAEIVGRNCRFLSGELTDPTARAQLRNAITQRHPVMLDIVNYRRDGTTFRNGVMITPIYGANGELAWFLGSQVNLGSADVHALKHRRKDAAQVVAGLPPRQKQVLKSMARGLLNKQIAWELKLSEKTVKMHRALLIERLNVATSAEAIRIAIEAEL